LLEQGRLPSSWIPPTWILDLRTTVRLRKTLVDQRTAWQQRIHAALFHHGLPRPTQGLLSGATRGWLEQVALPPAGRQALQVALRQIDHLDAELDPIDQWLGALARRQPGCRALIATHYGIGAITAPTILAELGGACLPIGKQMCRGQRPPSPCRHGQSVDDPKRPRGRALPGTPHRSSCRRTLMGPRTQIRLGVGTHEPVTITAARG
jgi:hypothetical protein